MLPRAWTPLLAALALGCGSDPASPPPSQPDGPYARDRSGRPPCPALGRYCDAPAETAPAISTPTQIVPATGLPAEIVSQTSHNNLDIVWFEGRLFFAFRTAPHHFASPEPVLYVMSTPDMVNWTFEARFDLDRDLREPRFLTVNGRLFLYFGVLGTNPLAFQPEGARVSEYLGPAAWGEPERIFDPGFIPWRARELDGTAYLIGYVGGENIYQGTGEGVQVHWLTTADGRAFEPAVAGQPVVLEGGGSETDFAFLPDGTLVAVSRNELGENDAWGSKICTAPPTALGTWTCSYDPKKYDSPLVFAEGEDVWLVGRRQLAHDGNYDLFQRELSAEDQTAAYEAEYWRTPKRCSLWSVDAATRTVEFALDLPSAGDTCFASVVPLGERKYLLFNYSSPLDEPDLTWLAGQQKETHIHALTLALP